MSRLPTIDSSNASAAAKVLLDQTQAQLGRVPNLYRTMANSPAGLEGYLLFRGALVRGELKPLLREQLALIVAEENHCTYCVSAHTFRGQKMGLSADELEANRRGEAADAKTAAALRFARSVVRDRGSVSEEEFAAVRTAGWSDSEIAEIVAHVALNTYSNIFNHVAQPTLDFPLVEAGQHA